MHISNSGDVSLQLLVLQLSFISFSCGICIRLIVDHVMLSMVLLWYLKCVIAKLF
ncbi:unnamed protein product [Brassica oleracea]